MAINVTDESAVRARLAEAKEQFSKLISERHKLDNEFKALSRALPLLVQLRGIEKTLSASPALNMEIYNRIHDSLRDGVVVHFTQSVLGVYEPQNNAEALTRCSSAVELAQKLGNVGLAADLCHIQQAVPDGYTLELGDSRLGVEFEMRIFHNNKLLNWWSLPLDDVGEEVVMMDLINAFREESKRK